ncbi:hypothetical protein O6H91_14G041600 [Diphasiastrum complanatum]|uniref:Uncharacterized protein n=1 Tax=Diphasiastrum complanatum TaxID=34168 RepID=A0ACC2BNU6_DIPCM|nr:hypothetical protein O6H91_14G041600 [Diphasiastrum complanatum]
MDPLHTLLNLVIPPSGLSFLALVWPTLAFTNVFQWLLTTLFPEEVVRKVVLITGASSGIGEQIAYEYAKRGARLALVARRENLLQQVAHNAKKQGAADVRYIVADVSREEDCKRLVEETINYYGRLDHLVNNAGLTHSFLFEDASDAAGFFEVMNVTFWGALYPTYYALPHLRKTRGKILVNDSVAAWLPFPRMSVYNAAKAALLNLYDTLRVEIGTEIGITIAMPGWIESEMTKGKFATDEGDLTLQRDVHVGPFPVEYAEECAKAMVSGVLKGRRYVIVPFWYSVFLLYRLLAPELLEWSYRLLFVAKAPGSDTPPSKILLETTPAKEAFYPETIRKSE